MVSCPGCGGELRFDPATRQLHCDHCDKLMPAEQFIQGHEMNSHMASGFKMDDSLGQEEAGRQSYSNSSTFQTYVFTCPQCGGELMADNSTAATFCSYCGSSTVLQCRVSDQMAPDFVIPFARTKDDCAKAYKNTITRALFAPNEFKQDSQIERFRGIYMPYWIYAFRKQSPICANGTKTYRRGDYIYTDHYRIGFDVDMDCAGLSHDASANFNDNLSEAIAPFDMSDAKFFHPAYLSGFYADVADVNSQIYVDDGQAQMSCEAANRARALLHTTSDVDGSALAVQLTPQVSRINMGFFPVWFLANRSKDGKRISYAVVNGQTGRVAADIPISFGKFILGTLLIALPIFGILCLLMNSIPFFSMTTIKMMVITIIIAIISWVVNAKTQNKLYSREMNLDDEGYSSTHELDAETRKAVDKANRQKVVVKKKGNFNPTALIIVGQIALAIYLNSMDTHSNQVSSAFAVLLVFSIVGGTVGLVIYGFVRGARKGTISKASTTTKVTHKAPAALKWKSCWKAVVSIVLCVAVTLIHPFEDTYYYAIGIISMILLGWSFLDVVRYHNRLMTRPVPQFEKRGGEEYEHR